MMGGASTPSSFTAPQNLSGGGHSLQAMARQTSALLPQGSFSAGNLSSAQSPRTKRTLSAFSAEVLLAAAAAVIAGCGSGGTSGGVQASDNRALPGGHNSRGDAASGLAGNLHGSQGVRGGAGLAAGMSGPAPDPLARRRRISLDLSVVVPPLPSAPSLGSTPASCSVLDLVSAFLNGPLSLLMKGSMIGYHCIIKCMSGIGKQLELAGTNLILVMKTRFNCFSFLIKSCSMRCNASLKAVTYPMIFTLSFLQSAKRSRPAGGMEDFSMPPSGDLSVISQPPSMTELYHSESTSIGWIMYP